MRPWPRTLLGRVFVLQLVLLALALGALTLLVTRHQARANAEQLALIWAPALADAHRRDDLPGDRWSITVRRDIPMHAGPPPVDAWNPENAPRFTAIAEALRADGLPVRSLRVSGASRDALLWVELADARGSRWIGVETTLEGEDLPARYGAALAAILLISLLTAAAIAWTVASPARKLSAAVTRFGGGEPDPDLPRGGPAEIRALVDSVRETFAARRMLDAQRAFMLAGLSHDLRAPLSRIRLAAELADAETWQATRQRIVENTDAVDRMIDAFATLVRDETGALDMREEIGATVAAAAQAAGWVGTCDIARRRLEVASRGTLLRRLVDNLIENALRHGTAPRSLCVEPGGGHHAVLTVANGLRSVADTDIDRLRRPFERGEAHRGSPGNGLGLSIVDRIAARLGGRLELELRDGRHWVARVSLPLLDGAGSLAITDRGSRHDALGPSGDRGPDGSGHR